MSAIKRSRMTYRYCPYARPSLARRRAALRKRNTAMYKVKKVKPLRSKFARNVMAVVNRAAETKEVYRELAVNQAIRHNNVMLISSNAFYSEVGTRGEDLANSSATGTRVGKTIFLKGIKVAINLEALQKRPQTTYWLYLVKNKTNPDEGIDLKSEMFEGRSSTIPMDYIDTDKVQVMFCKKFVLRMPNQATSSSMAISGFAPLAETGGNPEYKGVVTNPQKIEKFYVPINRKIEYRDDHGDNVGRTFPIAPLRYQWVMIGYDNYYSPSDPANADSHIGSLHMTTVMKFTDV